MTPKRKLVLWIVALGALHVFVASAGFLAPYDPAAQDRQQPYVPPMRLHFLDSRGQFHLRPFFNAANAVAAPSSNLLLAPQQKPGQAALQFFVVGARYRLFGIFPARLHLFGANGDRFYLLGSDAYGRDVFSRILYGGQISLLAGLLGTVVTLLLGVAVGAAAGYFGGWKDELLMRLAELFLALPWLYLLFALRAFLPLTLTPAGAFPLITLVLGAVGWARPARLVRGIVLSAKERDCVRAARGFGASGSYLLRRHILPQSFSVVVTQAAMLVPQFVAAEMTLSFLGLGVPEPLPSWGNLLSSLQQYSVLVSYWWMYLPAFAIVPFFVGYLRLASLLQASSQP